MQIHIVSYVVPTILLAKSADIICVNSVCFVLSLDSSVAVHLLIIKTLLSNIRMSCKVEFELKSPYLNTAKENPVSKSVY